MKSLLFWKVITITAAYAICILLLICQYEAAASEAGDVGGGGGGHGSEGSREAWRMCIIPHAIYAVPLTAAGAHLAFSAAKMSLEKDWVVTIAGGDKEWLSSVNSKMTQIDLAW
jgi:hypothetical protein